MATTDKNRFKRFESVGALVKYLDEAEVQPNFQGEQSSLKYSEWYGYESYDQARDMLLRGDRDLCKNIVSVDKLNMHTRTQPTMRVYEAVAGFAAHVPNYVAGVPNAMIMAEMVEKPAPVITIVYNVGVSGNYEVDEIVHSSSRILSAIASIERKGIQCNLYIASAQKDEGQRVGYLCKIKTAGQYMDTLKMAVPLVSPAMNRRFGFRFRETMPSLKLGWVNGYGVSMQIYDFKQWLNDMGVKYDIALTCMDTLSCKSVEDLEKMFLDSAAKAQIKKH